MYPASNEFRAAVRGPHVAVSRAEIWRGPVKVLDLDVADGSVNVSVSQATRRTCSVSFQVSRLDNGLVPDNPFDVLTPFGNELHLYRGVRFADGLEELIPLGVFVIQSIDFSESSESISVSLSGVDRSIRVSRNLWTEPYQVEAGLLVDALSSILQDRWPAIDLAFPPLSVAVEQQILGQQSGTDPWKDAVYLAEISGYDLFFDANGVCVLEPFPVPDAVSVVTSFSDEDVIVGLNRQDTTDGAYNGVIYIVESSWLLIPFKIEVWDEDPGSPTYRFGQFGEVPYVVSQSAITDEAEARAAATALLSKGLGMAQNISWDFIVDPSLDVNDVVGVRNAGTKTDRIMVIDNLTIPLSPQSTMRAQARTVRVVE
jgi:hypothetical protein